MDDNSGSVMIALLPITSDWCHIELPHMTLVYAGEIKDLEASVFNELGKDASMLSMLTRPLQLRVTGIEVFGGWDEEKVNVLRLQPTPELWSMRRAVERWNKSEHPFNPHCTIGPVGVQIQEMPRSLAFNRILVAWGKEKLTFELNTGSAY